MNEYVPNPRIVDRAVELWVEMLRKPTYDNGETDLRNFVIGQALLRQLPKNNDEATLKRFGEELRKILMAPLESESSWSKNEDGTPEKFSRLWNNLDVDYHPNIPLATAAERAGLKMEFPYKTDMWLYEEYLWLSAGYCGKRVYHYPLSDDRWLVTTLNGSPEDVAKLVKLVESGVLTADLTLNAVMGVDWAETAK